MVYQITKQFKTKFILQLPAWILALTIAGYPLVAALSVFYGIENRWLSVPFRGFILIQSLLVIGYALRRCLYFRLTFFWGCWWLFWLLYIFRIFTDYFFQESQIDLPMYDVLLNAVCISMVPAFALGLKELNLNYDRARYFIVILGVIGLTANLLLVISEQGLSGIAALALIRAETKTINPISIGQLGVSLIIISSWTLLFRKKLKVMELAIFLMTLVVGLIGLISSGSRGPIVSLAAPMFLIVLTIYSKGSRFSKLAITAIGLVLLFIISSAGDEILLLKRASSSLFADDTRSELIANGVNVIISNPILGAGIQPLYLYPHNVILESYMAFGVLTGVTFTYMVFYGLYTSFKLRGKSPNAYWLSLLYVQYFTAAMFSGSLYIVSALWVLLVVVIKCSKTPVCS